ncbi:MAG: hypothetical protein QXU73_06900 [Thermoplasmata archaeon]
MKRKNHDSGCVGHYEFSDTYGTFKIDAQGNLRYLTVEPIPMHKDCLFEKPGIDWGTPKRRGTKAAPPSGRVIDAIFGSEGWSKGWEDARSRGRWKDPDLALLEAKETRVRRDAVAYPGLEKPVKDALIEARIENLRTWDQRSDWTEKLAQRVYCNFCKLREPCYEGELRYEHVRKGPGGRTVNRSSSSGGGNPLHRRMEVFMDAWAMERDAHFRRAALIITLLGKAGARPGGYYKNDIARIAGIRPDNYASVERLVRKLCDWGLLERQKRRGKQPRFRCRYGGGMAIEKARNEGVKRYIEEAFVNPISSIVKHDVPSGRGFSFEGPPLLLGEQPPKPVIEVIQKILDIAIVRVFEERVEGRLLARSAGKDTARVDTGPAAASEGRRMRKELDSDLADLDNICNSVSVEDAQKWEDMRGRLVSGEISHGPFILLDVGEIIRGLSS